MQELALIKQLLALIEQPSYVVPKLITQILQQHYQVLACCFYSYSQQSQDELILLGQSGLPLQAFESIRLSKHDSLAGRSLSQEKPLFLKDLCENDIPLNHLNFQQLSAAQKPNQLIALPLTAQNVKTTLTYDDSSFYGVVCFYFYATNGEHQIQSLLTSLELIAEFISEVYLRTIVHDRMLLRQEIIDKAFSAKDLNSFSHKVLDILHNSWGIEAASIYMLDERTQTLRLSATTHLADPKKNKDTVLISLKKKGPKNCVLDCFNAKNIQITSKMTGEPEAISMPVCSIMSIPIFHPANDAASMQPNSRRIIGVLKCVNKLVYHDHQFKGTCVFDFADKDRMSLVADFIGAIAILFWRVSHINEDFERTVHGVLNNVVTIRASLGNLDRYGKLDQYLMKKLHYIIPDSISHLDALNWQIGKFSNRDRKPETHCRKVLIHAHVLAKALQIARPLALYFNILSLDLKSGIKSEELKLIPPIYGDPDLLVTVFRNLIENSIKYAQRDKESKISIWWEDGANAITLFMQDNGIGIDDEDGELIFTEGYRSEEAIRRVTSGASAGLGLFQCRSILNELNSDIRLQNYRNPTTFCITLPKWR